jgi:hypothetical protein
MKLRIRNNSIRVRLDRTDLAELLERGLVRGALRFGPGSTHTFTYAVMIGSAPPAHPRADYSAGLLVITIHPVTAQLWAAGTRIGFDEEQAVEGGTVRVILEKDFTNPDRLTEDAAEDTWAFPNRSVVCR